MKEKLYTIPVNDAFNEDCECPVCAMHETLRKNAVSFTLGPSYMEDDVRMVTNKVGFCPKHVQELYKEQNRLGIALMLLTHMDEVLYQVKEKSKKGREKGSGLFKKEKGGPLSEYLEKVNSSCFVCDKIEETFKYYIMTIFHEYVHNKDFAGKLRKSKGFCMEHYKLLYDEAVNYLSGKDLSEFTDDLNKVFIENLKRVRDDLEWYTDKFDYRNQDAPWKNSKDAVQRSIMKMDSVNVEPKQKN